MELKKKKCLSAKIAMYFPVVSALAHCHVESSQCGNGSASVHVLCCAIYGLATWSWILGTGICVPDV